MTELARVVNIRRDAYDVYIGRAGHGHDGYFGNPIRVGKPCPVCGMTHTANRATIPCFEIYFLKRIERDPKFRARVDALQGKVLGCFCKPHACHGDVIVGYLFDQLRAG